MSLIIGSKVVLEYTHLSSWFRLWSLSRTSMLVVKCTLWPCRKNWHDVTRPLTLTTPRTITDVHYLLKTTHRSFCIYGHSSWWLCLSYYDWFTRAVSMMYFLYFLSQIRSCVNELHTSERRMRILNFNTCNIMRYYLLMSH